MDSTPHKTPLHWIRERKMVLIGISLGVLAWILESAIHAFVFYHDSFIHEILSPPDTHEIWMRSVIVILFILFGFYTQFIVNQRNRAEQKARESETRLLKIIDTVQAGIVLIDWETRIIIDVNKAAIEMIHAPREHITGKHCNSFFCPSDQGECPIIDLGQHIDDSDRALITAEGKRIPILKTVTTVWLSGRKHLLESFLDISYRKQVEQEREELIKKLQKALTEVKTLSGLLPICASCKKIRDDKGYWNQLETYIRDHSEAEFSHSLCPECAKKLYPELQLNNHKSK